MQKTRAAAMVLERNRRTKGVPLGSDWPGSQKMNFRPITMQKAHAAAMVVERGTKSTDQALENQFFPLPDHWFPDSETRFPNGEFCFLYGIQCDIS